MTVSTNQPINSSIANGITAVFPYGFKINHAGDLLVTVNGVVRTLDTHYTVTGVGVDDGVHVGGNITFQPGFLPPSGAIVTRRRAMAFQRSTDYQNLGDLLASTLNADQDDPVMMIQQLAATALQLIQNGAGEFVWDAQGNRIINVANGVDPSDAVNLSQLAAAIDPSGSGVGVAPKKWDFVGDGTTTDFPITGATVFDPLFFDAAKAGAVIEPGVDYTIIGGDNPMFRFTTAPGDGVTGFAVLRGYAKAASGDMPITTTASTVISTDGSSIVTVDGTFQNNLLLITSNTDITLRIKKTTGSAGDWKSGEYFSVMQVGTGQVTLAIEDGTGTLTPSPGFLAKTRGQGSIISASCMYADADAWAISGDLLRATATPDKQCFRLPCSDQATTDIAAATNVHRMRMPYSMLLSEVRATLNVAQSSGTVLTVDVKQNGTSIFTTTLTIDNNENTSTTAATPYVLVNPNTFLDDGDLVSVDVTQVGSSGARGLEVQLIGSRV